VFQAFSKYNEARLDIVPGDTCIKG
jgi:hypothetical protein